MTKSKSTNRLSRTRGPDYQAPEPVPVAKRRRGRPEIEVEPEMIRIACVMARYGATDVEIAQELGIATASFYNICGRNPQFLEAIREGKDAADDRVQNSMYALATGFTYEAEKVFSNGFRATVHERVLPNPAAGIHWLRNRRNWRSGDNVVADAIDAAQSANAIGEPPSTRTMALAALALLGAAIATPDAGSPTTIDVTPNASRATEDEDDDLGEEPAFDDRDDFDF